jgi:hypothetical protein
MHIKDLEVSAISWALREAGFFYHEVTSVWTAALHRAYQEYCGAKLFIENHLHIQQPAHLHEVPEQLRVLAGLAPAAAHVEAAVTEPVLEQPAGEGVVPEAPTEPAQEQPAQEQPVDQAPAEQLVEQSAPAVEPEQPAPEAEASEPTMIAATGDSTQAPAPVDNSEAEQLASELQSQHQ